MRLFCANYDITMKGFWVFFSLFAISFLTISCKGEKIEDNQQLKDEVIAIHDEVMPLMGQLRSLRQEILDKSATLEQEDSVLNAEKIAHLNGLAEQLDQAFEGMFVWMRQFDSNFTGTEEELKSYLLDQKVKVQEVNEDIKTALSAAKEELGKS